MWPLCSPPSRLPAPRSSRSSAAILKPAPRSVNSFSAASRRRASGVSSRVGRNQQVGVGAAVGAPHASAQLVELGQPVAVGAVDDDGVAQRDVEPVLDDGGRHQHVGLVPHEGQHHLFQLAFAHLPVAHEDARPRHQLAAPWPRSRRSIPRGCGRSTPARRAPARARWPIVISFSSQAATTVWMAMRSLGGVSITLMSRSPTSDMCSVRGIGVADMVSTSTSLLAAASAAPCGARRSAAPRPRPPGQVGELDVLGEQAVGADQDVHLAGLDLLARSPSAAGRCGSG